MHREKVRETEPTTVKKGIRICRISYLWPKELRIREWNWNSLSITAITGAMVRPRIYRKNGRNRLKVCQKKMRLINSAVLCMTIPMKS